MNTAPTRLGGRLVDEALLWQARSKGDADAREQLIELHLPLARLYAGRLYAGRTASDVEYADYLQLATIGLIEAVDRFDADRGLQFSTYASYRIQGAILNGLEHENERLTQCAAYKRLSENRQDSLKTGLKQGATDLFQQLADIAIGLAIGYLLEDTQADSATTGLQPEHQYAGVAVKQLRSQLHQLIETLAPKERLVIKSHYLNHIPFESIATNMGLTKGRVSQIHKQAIDKLRAALREIDARHNAC